MNWQVSMPVTIPTENNKEQKIRHRVAVPLWIPGVDLAKMIGHDLNLLHHEPVYFSYDAPIPEGIDVLLTFGPYNKVLPIWQKAAQRKGDNRPVVVHWNTEGMPDLRIPMAIMRIIGAFRSKIGRLSHSSSAFDRYMYSIPSISRFDRYMLRYRYIGDYEYAYKKGWLHILADSSQIYGQMRSKSGVPTLYTPWGASKFWYSNLGLERDIDVLWMGKRGTQRRSEILDQVCESLKPHGVKVYIADNEQNPFIFGKERTHYLNRAKITLNITRTWYDDNFSRFTLAAPNRSLIVSEPVLPHCLEFKEKVHYVSTEIPDLARTVLYYLENEAERQQIVENAYNLVTTELLFCKSLNRMLAAAALYRSFAASTNQNLSEVQKYLAEVHLEKNRPFY